jgi:hypothetical protein
MRIVIYSLIVSIQVMIYTSCGICSKKIDCAGFDDKELTAWFPYSDGELLIFRNNVNEQQSFTLKNTYTSQPYQGTGGFSNTLRCSAERDFESIEKDSSGRTKFLLNLQVSSNTRSGLMNINQTPIYFNNLTDTCFLQVIITSTITRQEKLTSFNTGSNSFTNVTVATADTNSTKTQGIYKLYFSKNVGLIAYSEYPSLKTWIKQ